MCKRGCLSNRLGYAVLQGRVLQIVSELTLAVLSINQNTGIWRMTLVSFMRGLWHRHRMHGHGLRGGIFISATSLVEQE